MKEKPLTEQKALQRNDLWKCGEVGRDKTKTKPNEKRGGEGGVGPGLRLGEAQLKA